MNYGSVCSGIEAASLAWHSLGWKPAFFSEIDPFARSVLAHWFPDVPLHGDFTTIQDGDYGPIDVLVGGTPCQSFSIAGLRGGMDDDRGNLALEYLRLARRLRAKWLVWENVPGVLSSNGGRDFGSIIGGMVKLGYGVAYRVLDAQYFGVPQRRRRVFVVGYLGDWRRAAAVLFERESLRRDSAPRRQTGKSVAVGTIGGTSPGGGWRFGADEAASGQLIDCSPSGISGTVSSKWAKGTGGPAGDEHYNLIAPTLLAQGNETGGHRPPGTTVDTAGSLIVGTTLRARDLSRGVDSDCTDTLIAHTLRGDGFDASEDGTGRGTPLVPVAFSCKDHGADAGDIAPTLRAMGHGASHPNAGGQVAVSTHTAVRRLTPRECERLQGFPDDWTLVPHRGKPAADGPRYKAIGNSMAVPVMRWIGERIAMVDAL